MIVLQITPEDLRAMISTAVTESMPQTIQAAPVAEIINREELCVRLGVSVPTIIRMEKRKKIPVMHIGTSVRYDYAQVLKSLYK